MLKKSFISKNISQENKTIFLQFMIIHNFYFVMSIILFITKNNILIILTMLIFQYLTPLSYATHIYYRKKPFDAIRSRSTFLYCIVLYLLHSNKKMLTSKQ